MDTNSNGAIEGPIIIELLGHRILSGYAREVELCDTKLLRLDVALPEGRTQTQFYTASASVHRSPTPAEYLTETELLANQARLAAHGLLWPDELERYHSRLEAESAALRERYSLPLDLTDTQQASLSLLIKDDDLSDEF